jgi:hypothetical protein
MGEPSNRQTYIERPPYLDLLAEYWRDRITSLLRYTLAGRRIAICPATYSDATCNTCGLRPRSGCCDRFPGARRMAEGREGYCRPRRTAQRAMGIPGSPDDG